MRKSFKLITVFDIPIEINYTWFIVLGLVVFSLAARVFPLTNPEAGATSHWIMAFITATLFFSSLLAHELAHSLIAKKNKLPISGITLFIFGGVAHMEDEPHSPKEEFQVAIAGPIMSFFLALVFFGLAQLSYNLAYPNTILTMINHLVFLNLAVGVFNLIPGFPLDGGRVFRSILWHFYKDLKKATAIASAFGKGFAFFIITLGILYVFTPGLTVSGIWFIFIGIFLLEAAELSYRHVVMNKLLGGTKVESLMTKEVITVPANMPLDKLLDNYFFKYRHASFPVLEGDNILGLVTFHDVKEVPQDKWSTTTAREAMEPVRKDLIIHKNTEAMDALAKLASNGIGRRLVIEHAKLIGILSRKDIMRLFEFKAEIEK